MAFINKQDTDGTKAALAEGEMGYDKQGSDRGRAYVGTDSGNKALGFKSEIDAKANIGDSYTKAEEDAQLALKASLKATSTVYGGSKMSLSGSTLTITTT